MNSYKADMLGVQNCRKSAVMERLANIFAKSFMYDHLFGCDFKQIDLCTSLESRAQRMRFCMPNYIISLILTDRQKILIKEGNVLLIAPAGTRTH